MPNVTCPDCTTSHYVGTAVIGEEMTCPTCDHVFTVQADSADQDYPDSSPPRRSPRVYREAYEDDYEWVAVGLTVCAYGALGIGLLGVLSCLIGMAAAPPMIPFFLTLFFTCLLCMAPNFFVLMSGVAVIRLLGRIARQR